MHKLESSFKLIYALLIRVAICALVGTLLLIAVYHIPLNRIEENTAQSAEVLQSEGSYFALYDGDDRKLDNFTDALMLLTASYNGHESPVIQAMNTSHFRLNNANPCDSLVGHYMNDLPFSYNAYYSRYWHGYLVFLKPLLSLFSYQQIRSINYSVQFLLIAVVLVLLLRKKMGKYIIPFLVLYLLLMPAALGKSLQFSSCFYILLSGSIAVILQKDFPEKDFTFIFLYLGIATAYFDLLTYPLATLGIPAVWYFCIQNRSSIKKTLVRGFQICFSWGFGYVVMWSLKWIIGSLILKQNVLSDATSRVIHRSSMNIGEGETLLTNIQLAIQKNYTMLSATKDANIWMAVTTISLVVLIFLCIKHRTPISYVCTVLFPFVVLMAFPFIWYAVITNHSIIHAFFTHRTLVIAAFAATSGLIRASEISYKQHGIIT